MARGNLQNESLSLRWAELQIANCKMKIANFPAHAAPGLQFAICILQCSFSSFVVRPSGGSSYSPIRGAPISTNFRRKAGLRTSFVMKLRELLIILPALVHSFLRQTEQVFGGCRIALLKNAIATLGIDVILERQARLFRVQLESVLSLCREH